MIYLCSNTPSDDKSVIWLNLCQIKYLPFSVDLSEFSALIISSKNAIKALSFNKIKPNPSLEVFAIGQKTAQAALDFGFKNVRIALNSHGNEFAKEITQSLQNHHALLLSPKEQASDIKGILENSNIKFNQIIAYENTIKKITENLDFPKNSIFIFTSPKNVEAFLFNFTWRDDFRAVAIGKTTAQALFEVCEPVISEKQNISQCIKIAKNLV